MQEKVSRLRALMAEAVPRPVPMVQAEEDMWARYQNHAANSGDTIALDDSDRARAVRTINRIAHWYGASSVIVEWLDRQNATGIAALGDDQVQELRRHMERIEDCAQQGFDSPFAPPAS